MYSSIGNKIIQIRIHWLSKYFNVLYYTVETRKL